MIRLIQLITRIGGVLLIAGALYYAATEKSALAKGGFTHLPSLVFVCAIVTGVALVGYQTRRLLHLLANLTLESPTARELQMRQLSARLHELSDVYYKEGPGALKRRALSHPIPPLWKGVLLQLEARVPLSDIQILTQNELKNYEDEINHQIDILSTLGGIGPSAGLLGTVLGLIKLLSELQDISALGGNMALALVTALYGIFLNVLVFSPLAARLETVRDVNVKAYEQALFWLHLVENRKPSFYCDPESLKDAS